MSRFLSTMKTDMVVQVRTNLYTIGIGAGVLVAVALSQLASPDQLVLLVPTLMLLVVGGSTLLYVSAMIIFEKDEGTLWAMIVSPVRPYEYLWSKIITLTGLATLESVVMIGGAMLIMRFSGGLALPNLPLLLLGIVAIGILYTLIGIILVVRYRSITDYLIPMAGVAVVLQLPFLYFLGWVEHWAFLLVPTSAPTMLMVGAYRPLAGWEWAYGVGGTAVLLIGLTLWAYRAFQTHVIQKVG
ncbi:MAG: ABC transporter permease [Anaerolineaceae bacterium]|nr:ABC transporter permease [Anaerolineaceae bacterium]